MPIVHVHGSSTSTSRATVVADPPAPPLTAPLRNRYFYGKMLDVRHLEMEQAYFLEHRRRLNRLTVGYGVVCGLEVTVGTDGKAICVAPGFAIDAHGREIVVTEQICVEDPRQLTDSCGRPAGTAKEDAVTLCLAYHECDTDPSPVLVDDCDVHEGCAAGAVRERYRLLVHDGVPDEPPYEETPLVCRLIAARLASLEPGRATGRTTTTRPIEAMVALRGARGGLSHRLPGALREAAAGFLRCAAPEESCVVLATVGLPDGDAVTEPVLDFNHRRTVLSNDRLFEAILCLAAAVERCCEAREGLAIAVVSGDAQSGKQDQPLDKPVVVEVTDSDGDPVAGETVDFAVTSALGGSFEPVQGTTDDHGQTEAMWTVGKAGDQTATATLSDGETQAPITATAKD